LRRRTQVDLMKYTFHIVDVFSSTPFGGHQLAVLPDAAGTAKVFDQAIRGHTDQFILKFSKPK
jgi:predicted PhzF superfamily epimerase YddE/YHI9